MLTSRWQWSLDISFFLLSNIAFLALEIFAIAIVKNTKYQAHAQWLKYFVVESCLALVYRILWHTHFFTGIHLPPLLYTFARTCLYIANIVGVFGTIVLCRTLKRMVTETAQEQMDAVAAHSVWPPPPLR